MKCIRWVEEIGYADTALAGGKGVIPGEPTSAGFPLPPGFCLTSAAYKDFIHRNGIDRVTEDALREVRLNDLEAFRRKATRTREAILPALIANEIIGPSQERGLGCWASLWAEQVVAYKANQALDYQAVSIFMIVQTMIPSEISGVLFTVNPISERQDDVVFNASWGRGETIASGIRDTMHFEMTRLFPPIRQLILELDRHWSEKKLILRDGQCVIVNGNCGIGKPETEV